MEAVSAVVEATVTAAWVDAVAVGSARRVRVAPGAAENGQRQQREGKAGSEEQRQMRERMATAPP